MFNNKMFNNQQSKGVKQNKWGWMGATLVALSFGCVAAQADVGTASSASRVGAGDGWVGLQLGTSRLKSEGSDFRLSGNYGLSGGWWLNENIGLELGASALRKGDERGEDNRGTYVLSVDANDYHIGPRFSSGRHAVWQYSGSAGFLYSRAHMSLKEAFYGLKEPGEATSRSTGNGYYVAGGVTFAPARSALGVNGAVSYSLWLRYRQRLDLISTYRGDQDLSDLGVVASADFRF
ncbi:hypothetical protein HDN1F_04360 [gamma proteobacterium HdN1]|nr:hypothetical protein HDN1F_04360 [gamma proteobacterium HdN1]